MLSPFPRFLCFVDVDGLRPLATPWEALLVLFFVVEISVFGCRISFVVTLSSLPFFWPPVMEFFSFGGGRSYASVLSWVFE
jgi:hypothetical protein